MGVILKRCKVCKIYHAVYGPFLAKQKKVGRSWAKFPEIYTCTTLNMFPWLINNRHTPSFNCGSNRFILFICIDV